MRDSEELKEEKSKPRFVPIVKQDISFPKPSHVKLVYAQAHGKWTPNPAPPLRCDGCRKLCLLNLVKVHRVLPLALLEGKCKDTLFRVVF